MALLRGHEPAVWVTTLPHPSPTPETSPTLPRMAAPLVSCCLTIHQQIGLIFGHPWWLLPWRHPSTGVGGTLQHICNKDKGSTRKLPMLGSIGSGPKYDRFHPHLRTWDRNILSVMISHGITLQWGITPPSFCCMMRGLVSGRQQLVFSMCRQIFNGGVLAFLWAYAH